MKYIAIVDTETTGLPPGAECIEVAACLYSLEQKAPLAYYASLIGTDVKNEAVAINGITDELLTHARASFDVWATFTDITSRADAFVAHRSEFDSQFIPKYIVRDRPWICSKFDIEWPNSKLGDGLVHVALAHGCGVLAAHRALTDVETLVRVFQRVPDMEDRLVRAMRPKARYVAKVSYAEREKAKSAGFAWDNERKEWWRNLVVEDLPKFEFAIEARL